MRHCKLHHFLILFIILSVSGCATTNQAPFPVQQYSDLTSRYNAYFNAKEKMKFVLVGAEKSYKDKYDDVIPLFFYNDKSSTASYTGDLDDIEKRCTKAIQIHKYSNFVDDHFLMIARANFLKGDYDKALQNLKFITTEYKEGVDYVKEVKRLKGKNVKPSKKKKPKKRPKFEKQLDEKGNLVLVKIDERPSYSAFVHEPARAEALIWIAKAYTAKKKFAEAASIIQLAKNDDKFYKNLDKDLLLAEANLYMAKKDWSQATLPLEKYLTMTKKKKLRIRPLIALAQIYERLGDNAKSASYYRLALKSNPSYEADFFARIQQIRLSRKGKIKLDEIKKMLVKMSKDGKYKETLDQIYFELGEIAMTENNRPQAREWYKKSVANSVANVDAKSAAYLRLAQMDYEEELYTSSKFYYDSTMLGLSAKDTAYETVALRAKVLGDLVTHLTTISTEDSLQRLAKMSPSERERVIKNLIAKKEKEEEKKAENNLPKNTLANNQTNSNPNAITSSDGAWYFYNPSLRSNGYTEFVRRWGNRKFEENWRRKDKTSTTETIVDGDPKKDNKTDIDNTSTGTDTDRMTAALPLTPEKLKLSDDKLIEAYYGAGVIYKNDLKNYKKATQKFEELIRKFPKSKLDLESLYQLYLLAQKGNSAAKIQDYKSRIINEYPTSKIALFLLDPTYAEKEKEKENEVANYYQSAYTDFKNGLYASAAQKCKMADVDFKPNPLKPKFDLLNAYVLSKENRLDDYVQWLNKLIEKYKGTEEGNIASDLLANLNSSKLPMTDWSKVAPPAPAVDTALSVQPTSSLNRIDTTTTKPPTPDTKVEPKPTETVKKEETTKAVEPKTTAADSTKLAPGMVKEEVKKDSVKPLATVIEETINGDRTDKEELFGVSDNAPHSVILYYRNSKFYDADIFAKLAAFEEKEFAGAKYTNRSVFIDAANKLIVIKSFDNKAQALAFAATLKSKLKEAANLTTDQAHIFAINSLNYTTLISTKRVGNYLNFYEENYK